MRLAISTSYKNKLSEEERRLVHSTFRNVDFTADADDARVSIRQLRPQGQVQILVAADVTKNMFDADRQHFLMKLLHGIAGEGATHNEDYFAAGNCFLAEHTKPLYRISAS